MEKQEPLNTLTNANEIPKGDSLIEREQIPGSPYWVVGNKETGYSLVFGKYKITEGLPTKLDAELHLEENKYSVILKTILCVIDFKSTEEGPIYGRYPVQTDDFGKQ